MSKENLAKETAGLEYRPDIDGLRAVAVLSVLVFHVFHGILPGGYLGVDVFFVISGYLITQILVKDCRSGEYSIRKFYERRIRRIIPALLFVIVVTSALALFILLPGDFIKFGYSAVATLLFASNIYFFRDANYFSEAAETKPLLHTWSLGVEEQFYILFPILVYLVLRYRTERWLFWLIVAGSVVSFVVATWAIATNLRFAGFYLLPARAWELGIGAIAILAARGAQPSARIAVPAVTAGAAAVVLSLVFADQYFLAPFPPATLLCIGTGLLLWAGRAQSPVRRVLALRPFVWFGLISYSLYLWHWPIFVLAKYYLVRDFTFAESCVAAGASIAMAYLSWRFVENPFRRRTMPMPRLLWINAVPATAIAGLVAVAVATQGLPGRFSDEAIRLNMNAGNIYKCPLTDWILSGGTRACKINGAAGDAASARVAMYGDSHALMYAPALEEALKPSGEPGLLFYTNGCQALIGVNRSQRCLNSQNANVRAIAQNPAIEVVVVAFSWVRLDLPAFDKEGRAFAKLTPKQLEVEFDRLIGAFLGAGKEVVVVGPIPHPGYDLASVTSREVAFYGELRSPLRQSKSSFDAQFSRGQALIDRLPTNVLVVTPANAFCNLSECSYMLRGVMPYADSNHIVQEASRSFGPLFREAIEEGEARARAKSLVRQPESGRVG